MHESFTWFSLFLPEHLADHHFIHVVIGYFVAAVLILLACLFILKLKKVKMPEVPDKKLTLFNFFDLFGEMVYGLCKNTLGDKRAKKYFPAVATLFLFILFSNLLGLIPGFLPPTDNINTTLACGIFVFFYYNFHGVKELGIKKYLAHFCGPLWYMAILIFPLEILSHMVRPLSLGLRLRGNMFGDHLVLSLFTDLVPFAVPLPFYALGTLVSFIQAFVFCMLTIVYLAMATAHDH